MSEFLLPHQQLLISRVTTALEEIGRWSNSQGILFIGGSGSGKSYGLDALSSDFRSSTDGPQRIVPCCRVGADSAASATSIACAILAQLGIPLRVSSKFKQNQLEATVIDALRACRVRLLILEELHNALKANSPQLRGRLSRFLKNLWNLSPAESALNWAQPDVERGDHKLVIVASGTRELMEVFDQPNQSELRSRFSCRIEASKLSFDQPESFRAFRGVLDAMIKRAGLQQKLFAADNEVASRALIACEGHLRVLETLLRRCDTLEKRSPGSLTPLDLLAFAFDEVGGGISSNSNPFRYSTAEVAAYIQRSRVNHRLNKAKTRDKPKP